MRTTLRRFSSAIAGIALCATVLVACGSTNSTNTQAGSGSTTSLPPNTIAIDNNTGLFMPFISVVNAGTTVTFENKDTASHDIKSVPVAEPSEASFVNPGKAINTSLGAGASTEISFTEPGIYDLYDDSQATIDPTYHRVITNKTSQGFPYAPEAVIWVKGTITSLPTKMLNTVISGQDAFQLDFVAVKQGGSVTWHNYDTDPHYVTETPSFNSLNPSKIGDGTNELFGTADMPPNGQAKSFTFSTPGLYYYYCTAHANFDTTLNRAVAHSSASIYPIPMEGFVLVQ